MNNKKRQSHLDPAFSFSLLILLSQAFPLKPDETDKAGGEKPNGTGNGYGGGCHLGGCQEALNIATLWVKINP